MEFEGHQLHTIENGWVFDLTTFIGYYVVLSGDKVESYSKAFIVIRDNENGSYSFDKKIEIPVKIMRKTVSIIQKYRKEALLEDASR